MPDAKIKSLKIKKINAIFCACRVFQVVLAMLRLRQISLPFPRPGPTTLQFE
jgi:hypothetical protein